MFKEIVDKNKWEEFVKKNAPISGAFLHSWDWGEFQSAYGKKVVRLGEFNDEGQIQGVALLIQMQMPFGKYYWYCPRGPLFVIARRPQADEVISLSEKIASLPLVARNDSRSIFLRLDPITGIPTGAKKTNNVQPQDTLMLDLEKDEKELLARMHHKTRYNIRLAQRKEVEIDFPKHTFTDHMWSIFQQTSKRGDGFGLHKKEYYEQMLKSCNDKEPRAFLATASYQKQIVAVNIMMDYNGVRTYLHGASSNEYRNIMAPYALHWALISDAKKNGIKAYDWWGVAPEGAVENHPWTGITKFKTGFGGKRISFVGTYDLVYDQKMYMLYKIVKRLKGA
ncbi:MAG: peptidoglycan bridge formation glycyltransferase FemA/FemB family protein [Patescibacteria group bacterium]